MEFNNETIRIAVKLYVKNEKEGEEKYGHINTWNVSGVTNMSYMFSGTNSFNQPLSNWNVSNITDMHGMFSHTKAFNQPLDNWNVGNVTKMWHMFGDAKAFNQPLNNWNVSKVINMFGMFCDASSFNQPLDNWNVSNVITMINMFKYAQSFNQPLINWNVGKVTNMDDMGYMFDNTTIGEMLKKHNLTNKEFFESPTNKKVYHELFVWPRKKDYVTFLVNNQYLPLNKHQEKHEYHPLFDNTDISKYIACYL